MSCAISSLYTVNEIFFYVLINWFYLPSVIFNANAKICAHTVHIYSYFRPCCRDTYVHSHTHKYTHSAIWVFVRFISLSLYSKSVKVRSCRVLHAWVPTIKWKICHIYIEMAIHICMEPTNLDFICTVEHISMVHQNFYRLRIATAALYLYI